MKYKIYRQCSDFNTKEVKFFECDFQNFCNGFDSIDEAYQAIKDRGYDFVNYTILPYIYLT